MRRYGLDRHILQLLQKSFRRFPQIKRVLLFGSRGRGDFKNYSDIDLAVEAPDMRKDDFSFLTSTLDDLPIIFRIDTVRADTIKNKDLKRKINRDGRQLLPLILKRVSNLGRLFIQRLCKQAVRDLLAMMEPLLIVVMAVIVGFIIIGLMMPTFQMSNLVQ